MGTQTKSQKAIIREYLEAGNSITQLEALRLFGCFRLGARIWNLKQEGVLIKKEMIEKGGKWFARYSIEKRK